MSIDRRTLLEMFGTLAVGGTAVLGKAEPRCCDCGEEYSSEHSCIEPTAIPKGVAPVHRKHAQLSHLNFHDQYLP